MKSDFSVYSAVESLDGTIIRQENRDGAKYLTIALQSPIRVLLRASVSGFNAAIEGIISRNVLELKVPSELTDIDSSEYEIAVLAEVRPSEVDSILAPASFGFGPRPSETNGESEAIQRAVRWLMIEPGSDIWDSQRGGGLASIASGVLLTEDLAPLTRRVTTAVDLYNSYPNKKVAYSPWSVASLEVRGVSSVPGNLSELIGAIDIFNGFGEIDLQYNKGVSVSVRLGMELRNGLSSEDNSTFVVI